MIYSLKLLQLSENVVPLQRVFHSIRFKVNKRLEYSGTPFFMPLRQVVHIFVAYLVSKSIAIGVSLHSNQRAKAPLSLCESTAFAEPFA